MKLHLIPGKLIINKITSVKAITDNMCVKEVLRCVQNRGGGCWLNGHIALFSLDRPPKDKEVGITKTLLVHFLVFFFLLFFLCSLILLL